MNATRNILVVDDEQVVLDATRRILTAEGFPVCTAGDAESALALMQSAKPDVVIVDLKLPGLSGIEFLERAGTTYPHVVVIVTTGYSSVDHAVASLQSGAFDFLPKPFTFGELLSLIYRACRYREWITRTPASTLKRDGYHFLGMQAWAKPEPDGTALLGWTEVFQKTIGNVAGIALPGVHDQLQQGGPLARLTAADQWVHVAWSALSGRVLTINESVEQNPGIIHQDPLVEGWVARIRPLNLEYEVTHLRPAP